MSSGFLLWLAKELHASEGISFQWDNAVPALEGLVKLKMKSLMEGTRKGCHFIAIIDYINYKVIE